MSFPQAPTPTHATTTSSPAKATYVLVPGAWQPASAWGGVAEQLRAHGHTAVAVELPGQGHDSTPLAEVTLASHVAAVCTAVDAQAGRVILVGHSYGGVVISQVGENRPAKIQELVYVAGFLPANGESLLT